MTEQELTEWVESNSGAVVEAAKQGDSLALDIWAEALAILVKVKATGQVNTDKFEALVRQWEADSRKR